MVQLQLKDIRKSFGPVEVIHGIDLTVEQGELVVFVGPSGCGKSTMLRMIAGLEDVSSGEIRLDDEVVNELPPVKRGIAMVFQSYALYPNMSVRKNLAFSLEQAKLTRAEIKKRVESVAETLKLTPLLDRRPGQLSGGQSQRVAIGRAIVRDPRLFLFDEPLSNLDAELRVHMRVQLAKLHKRLIRTMIYVTHDQVEAMTLADRIAVFHAGKIEQVGTPLELYNNPTNMFVAGFIGSPRMNFLPFNVAQDKGNIRLSNEAGSFTLLNTIEATHEEVMVGIRPEHVKVTEAGKGLFDATVCLVEHLGGEVFLYCDLDGREGQFTAKIPGQGNFTSGMRIGIDTSLDHLYLFDPNTELALETRDQREATLA